MTDRKLSPEQIDYLFTFCGERGAHYYDVQIELVDHYASAIEKRWDTTPTLTFEQAVQLEYTLFNQYDFKQIIKEKEKSLSEKYLCQQKKYIQEVLKWPRILMAAAIALGVFAIFLAIDNFFVLYYFYILAYSLILFVFKYILFPLKYRFRPETEKSFLIIDHQEEIKESMNLLVHFSGLIFCTIFLFISPELSYSMLIFSKLFLAILFASAMLYIIAAYKYVPQRVKADFSREFPQFVKS
jgi:hypothetical protein